MDYESFLKDWRGNSNCILCQTSGSTGEPKGIEIPKSEMIRSAKRTIRFFNLDSSSTLHSCISPDYIGGKMMAVRAEVIGCFFSWEAPSNRPLQDYCGKPIDLLAMVPSQTLDLLDRIERGKHVPEIRHIILGGSPINKNLRNRIADSGLDVWETYGMTETASHIALRKVSTENPSFKTLPDITVTIGENSNLIIDIAGWKRVVTNDIARITSNGGFRILGRADNVIISGGKKIHPEEVERILEEKIGCNVLIYGKPDEKWGEKVVMIAEADCFKQCPMPNEHEIHEICREVLLDHCVPKEIKIATIPRTPNGKKQRKQ